MSKILSRLIDRPEDEVKTIISRLEATHGYPSHDVRLLAEVSQAVKQKIADLGLDPVDTTGEELYHGLQARFDRDAKLVDKALGVSADTGFEARVARAIEITRHVSDGAEVWALKPMAAKNLLLDLPPKKVLKQLHYRTLGSMLKRENVGELYLLLPIVESTTWQAHFAKTAAKLPSSDYGLQPINFVQPQPRKWGAASAPRKPYVFDHLTGSVSLWPVRSLQNAPVIALSLLLIQAVEKLDVAIDHEALIATHPALRWWANIYHLISSHGEGIVSLNIKDVAHNSLHGKNYSDAGASHGTKALWQELNVRYGALGEELKQSLDNEAERLIPAHLAAEFAVAE
ncbi:hypothetical protein BVY00_00720 [bacterium G20]|nr:hypothetical protein BVY00_00720 [bacterium G20]